MGPTAAAGFAGVSVGAAKKWAAGAYRTATPGRAVESGRADGAGRRLAWAPTSQSTPRSQPARSVCDKQKVNKMSCCIWALWQTRPLLYLRSPEH